MRHTTRTITIALMLVALAAWTIPGAATVRAAPQEARRMTEFDLQALHDEIEADPEGLGYKNGDGSWKLDATIVDLINDPANGSMITRKLIARNEVIYSIERGECVQIADDTAPAGLLSETERWWLSMALRSEVLDANDPEVMDTLLDMFPAEGQRPGFRGTTRANLQGILQRQGSRAEVLWGEGKTVSISEVAHAANL